MSKYPIDKVKNLYEFLDIMRIRPGMYIGKKSITVLHDYIGGYEWACYVHKIEENLIPTFESFNGFVEAYFHYGKTSLNWKGIILEQNNGNEELAFEEFYRLFDLFRKRIKSEN